MRRIIYTIVALIVLSVSAFAWDYNATGETTEQTVQMRVGADFTKKWDCGVRLTLGEELRFNLHDIEKGTTAKNIAIDTSYGASFYKSYTTLSLAYAHPHFTYLKVDVGYTLRLLGDKGWSDHNEFLRHRVFFGITGQYTFTNIAKLYIRERVVCDMRTDSVNLLEKNKYNWSLRSRIGAEFIIPGKSVKPYTYVELHNTLNAPEYQQLDGRQYINRVRAQVGVKWRLTRMSSLDFYYRFTYGYNRDINITKKKSRIELTEEKLFQHAIGVTYNLDW